MAIKTFSSPYLYSFGEPMIGKQSLLPTAALADSQWAEAISSTKLIAPGFFFPFV